MNRTYTVMDSPIGPITLTADDGVLSGLYLDDTHAEGERDDAAFGEAVEQLEEYFDGRRTDFDLELAPVGTPFQQQVWEALLEIPFGTTTTYGELAERIGKPSAARAVGLANGRNPISIVVPCHRVIGASGSLTGYGWGIDRKRYLLDHEEKVLQDG